MATITEVRDSLAALLTVLGTKEAVTATATQAAVDAAVATVKAEYSAEMDVLKTALDEATARNTPVA